jgi:tetratricopeptide (TPR) repeat protein
MIPVVVLLEEVAFFGTLSKRSRAFSNRGRSAAIAYHSGVGISLEQNDQLSRQTGCTILPPQLIGEVLRAMPSVLRSSLIAAFLVFSIQCGAFGEDANLPAANTGLVAADQVYRAGKFAEAEASYLALLKNDGTLMPARIGLVRAMLRQQKIDEAFEAVNVALAAYPGSPTLLAAKGDVQFRRGEMAEAEVSYLTAKKLDPKEVRAYLGLARLYASYSFYRKAYDLLQGAHEIAPDDIEVQRTWLRMLPRKERLAALEAYLAAPHPDDEEETQSMREYLNFLKAQRISPLTDAG